MWFFDNDQSKCSHFWYGGCGGNDNRFKSKKDCEKLCVTKSQWGGGGGRPRLVEENCHFALNMNQENIRKHMLHFQRKTPRRPHKLLKSLSSQSVLGHLHWKTHPGQFKLFKEFLWWRVDFFFPLNMHVLFFPKESVFVHLYWCFALENFLSDWFHLLLYHFRIFLIWDHVPFLKQDNFLWSSWTNTIEMQVTCMVHVDLTLLQQQKKQNILCFIPVSD